MKSLIILFSMSELGWKEEAWVSSDEPLPEFVLTFERDTGRKLYAQVADSLEAGYRAIIRRWQAAYPPRCTR